MKNKNIILIAIIVVLVILVLLAIIFRNKIKSYRFGDRGTDAKGMKIADNVSIKRFEYRYSGTAIGDIYSYSLKREDDKYYAEISYMNINDEDPKVVEVDSKFFDKILDIIKKHKANNWHGFDKYNVQIRDGSMSSLVVVFSDDTRIDVSGSNCFPDGYGKFSREIEEAFASYVEDVLPDKNL